MHTDKQINRLSDGVSGTHRSFALKNTTAFELPTDYYPT